MDIEEKNFGFPKQNIGEKPALIKLELNSFKSMKHYNNNNHQL